jgi:hypothetical protein
MKLYRTAEQKDKSDALRKAAVKAELRANTFQRRIDKLELQLAQFKGANVGRSDALDDREEFLNQREQRIKAEHERLAEAQQSLQSREQQRLQEQLFFSKVQALKREDLETREEKLAARERLLLQKEASEQSSAKPESIVVTSPSTCISACNISELEPICVLKAPSFIEKGIFAPQSRYLRLLLRLASLFGPKTHSLRTRRSDQKAIYTP